MSELSIICRSLNEKTENLLESKSIDFNSNYIPYIVNKCLAGFTDTILYVNEINQRPALDKSLQYLFLYNSLRPRKRFTPWLKSTVSDNAKAISEYYNCSWEKAKEYEKLLTKDQIKLINKKLYKGGLK